MARGGGRVLPEAADAGAGARWAPPFRPRCERTTDGDHRRPPPVIGITRCSRLDDYVASVERAGGRARVLEISESPRALVEQLDGLLLTGGGDIDPALYGEDRHPAGRRRRAGPGRVRDRSGAALDERVAAAAGDLPRRAGAQCRRRRHADPGHPVGAEDGRAAPPHGTEERGRARRQCRAGNEARTCARRACRDAARCRSTAGIISRSGRLGAGLSPAASAPDGIVEAIESAARRLLHRRPVAPRELLAHRRVRAAVRILRHRREGENTPPRTAYPFVNTPRLSTCGVLGKKSKPRRDSSP